jgi:hypothetical protein
MKLTKRMMTSHQIAMNSNSSTIGSTTMRMMLMKASTLMNQTTAKTGSMTTKPKKHLTTIHLKLNSTMSLKATTLMTDLTTILMTLMTMMKR